jgi:23S rRNA (uridine2552-2'-O)-methyltransferase
MFEKVQIRKPSSSRDRSREQYLLARGFRGVAPNEPADQGS